MASRGIIISLVLMVVLAADPCYRVAAQQSGCTPALTSLAPCLGFITGNSSTTPPSSCCSALSTVVQSSPRCLCSVFNGSLPSLGVPINQTQALQLPGACNIQTPPVSRCNAASGPGAPAASPVGAPAASPLGAPSTVPVGAPSESTTDTPNAAAATPLAPTNPSSNAPAEGGTKATPSPPAPVADGSNIKVSLQFVLLLLFVASYSSVAERVF
ncbi:non-specific lipid-transfer protein-like protein At2g13820 [Punica granatum]|uniref:Bifunctional inhibitor/plant lipid transfer protein/seed storage helical domain-containing protein n=2 Tax=Punica granatum TaxID=22663 RepID=A0A218W1X0_PUNGR|nr:non-specific lipid-transfer protein-like protein At2g13820 [Punica granatum]OWM66854.1 hypothetical protein CDL15_Pgr002649 [Punica granatum]PKI56545.1 hypothetical protein CRG98_023071 [Punica granatum]